VVPAAAGAPDAEIVAARDGVRAEAYADELGIPLSFGSYDELLGSDEVDAVYVPLPISMHTDWTVRALEAGVRAVLSVSAEPDDIRRTPALGGGAVYDSGVTA
jgi:predicted dehydrogenase